jgi:hypothetical protein
MPLRDSPTGRRAVDGVCPRAIALMAALFIVNIAWNTLLNTLVARSGAAAAARLAYDATLPFSAMRAAVGLAVATVAAVVILTAFLRSVTAEAGARGGSLGEAALTYGRAVVVAVAGAVVAAVGLAVLLFPGLLVLVHLPLVFVAVATQGDSVSRAVGRTWPLARGAQARIAAVCLAVATVPLAVALIAIFTHLLSPVAELVLGAAVTTLAATAGVVAFAALTDSLVDLSAGTSGTGSAPRTGSRQL